MKPSSDSVEVTTLMLQLKNIYSQHEYRIRSVELIAHLSSHLTYDSPGRSSHKASSILYKFVVWNPRQCRQARTSSQRFLSHLGDTLLAHVHSLYPFIFHFFRFKHEQHKNIYKLVAHDSSFHVALFSVFVLPPCFILVRFHALGTLIWQLFLSRK